MRKGFFQPLIIAAIFVLISAVTFIAFFNKGKSKDVTLNTDAPSDPFTFEECVVKNYKVSGFPRECHVPNGRRFLEVPKLPIDSTNWVKKTSILGFTYKCPFAWDCKDLTANNSLIGVSEKQTWITMDSTQNKELSTFQLPMIIIAITIDELRNSNYTSPIKWFNDLKEKNSPALEFDKNLDWNDKPFYAYLSIKDIKLENIGGKVFVSYPGQVVGGGAGLLFNLGDNVYWVRDFEAAATNEYKLREIRLKVLESIE